jgi:hypothetical protein
MKQTKVSVFIYCGYALLRTYFDLHRSSGGLIFIVLIPTYTAYLVVKIGSIL